MSTTTPVAIPNLPARPATAPTDPDDVPAPVHPEPERAVLVRDAYGQDPYAPEVHGADGEAINPDVHAEPKDRADPLVAPPRAGGPPRRGSFPARRGGGRRRRWSRCATRRRRSPRR